MIFPQGQPVYENLNTSFTQLDAMLVDLRANQFTGYVRLTAWNYEGVMLFDTGDMVNALEQNGEQPRHGPNAAEGIFAKAKEKDGALGVYRLEHQITQLLAGLVNSTPLFQDLSSDFTNLDKLIARMSGERHCGYIDIRLDETQDVATIFMNDGAAVATVLIVGGNPYTGSDALARIMRLTETQGAVFNVFRADLTASYASDGNLSNSFARRDMLAFWQAVLNAVERECKPDTFIPAFKRGAVEHASQFPFLDPFSAELEYKDGALKFDGDATLSQFNAGLTQVLVMAINKLTTEPANRDLIAKLKPKMTELRANHAARIQDSGLVTALAELFAA